MAEILPFAALRYSREKVGDLSLVTAPPYDIITQEMQDALYRRHPCNIVRLIRGKGENFHEEAGALLKKWREEGVLVRDTQPGIYLYRHRYKVFGRGPTRTRKGFVALVKLEDFGPGKALPHERTFTGPRNDRLLLLETTRANLCPIFALFSHKDLDALISQLMAGRPECRATDDDGMEHALWKMTDKNHIESIRNAMTDRGFLIADGHHRYEASILFRDRQREISPGGGAGPHEYVMMYFTSIEGKGLTILPTHRLVSGLTDLDREGYLTRMEKLFSVMEFPLSGGEQWARDMLMEGMRKLGTKTRAFGLMFQGDRAYYLLALKERELRSDEVMERFTNTPGALLDLDVTLLHSYLLPELSQGELLLEYVHRAEEAMDAVGKGRAQAAFLLNPTKIAQIVRVTEAGEVMPQKSTYFYPKLLSGLALRTLDG